jgi:hypothetical protein
MFSLVLLLLISSMVSAWGVSPARQFADNIQSTQKRSVKIVNNDAQDGYFKVSFAGKLGAYAEYTGGLAYLLSDQGIVDVPFTLTLPKNLEPGKNTLAVVLEQVSSGSENTVGASVTLVAEVIVTVPIDGEFVNADVIISTVSESEPVPITLSLFNTGTKSIPVWAEIQIKGPTNIPIKTLKTETMILEVGQYSKFESFWLGETYQGSYVAEVIVHYGSTYKTITKGFLINGDKVVSDYLSSDNFNLGQVMPVEIGIKNNWNTNIKSVYSEVYVLTKNG